MGKGEIARYEQFLLFPVFSKGLFSQGCQKVSLCGNGLTLHHKTTTSNSYEEPFQNIMGKGENAGSHICFPFPIMCLHFSKQIELFQQHNFCTLLMLSI